MHFVYPYFLFSLLVLSIPVIIHLFHFRKYKKVYFSNVSFLESLQMQNQKHARVKHLLVLACRMLALAALVFAFAQPFIPSKENRLVQEGTNAVSIYVNNGFGMQAVAEDGPLLEDAKRKAREIAASYKPSDQFQLLTNDFSGAQQRLLSRDEFLEQVDRIEVSASSRPLQDVAIRQQDVLNHSHGSAKSAYIISDFNKSASDLSKFKMDPNINLVLVPTRAQDFSNISIDSLWMDAPLFQVGSEVKINVVISNYSAQSIEALPVKLTINNEVRAVANVDLQANENKTVVLPFTLHNAGLLQGSVEIQDFPMVYDDALYFSFYAEEKVDVLSINESVANTYVSKLFDDDEAFVLNNGSVQNLDYSSLKKYRLIILNEVKNISSGLARELQNFMQQGGGVLLLPSAQANLKTYNQFLNGFSQLNYTPLDTHRVDVSNITYKHSLFKNVFEKVPQNVEMPKVFKHFPLRAGARTATESVLKLNDQSDLLVSMNVGSGLFYASAMPFDATFSDLPKQPLFVVLLYNMALSGFSSGELFANIGNPNPVEVRISQEKKSEVLKLKSANGDFEMIPELSYNGAATYIRTHNQIQKAGNYLLFDNGNAVGGVSFNYKRTDSKPLFYSDSELKSATSGRAKTFVIEASGKSVQTEIASINDGAHLWKWFILLALLSLLAEVLILRFWK